MKRKSISPTVKGNVDRIGSSEISNTYDGESIGDVWYCLKCRTHTKTFAITRMSFQTKNGGHRNYHQGICSRCDRRKSNMTPW